MLQKNSGNNGPRTDIQLQQCQTALWMGGREHITNKLITVADRAWNSSKQGLAQERQWLYMHTVNNPEGAALAWIGGHIEHIHAEISTTLVCKSSSGGSAQAHWCSQAASSSMGGGEGPGYQSFPSFPSSSPWYRILLLPPTCGWGTDHAMACHNAAMSSPNFCHLQFLSHRCSFPHSQAWLRWLLLHPRRPDCGPDSCQRSVRDG